MVFALLMMIVVGAMIGWITNWIAIKMLFHPYKERGFFCFKIQGLIPKRKAEIGRGIAQVVERELLSLQEILQKFDTEVAFEKIETLLDEYLDENLESKIREIFPLAAMFLGKDSLGKIKDFIKEAFLSKREELSLAFSTSIEESIDVKEMIEEKISSFSLEKLEEIITHLASRELKHIEWIGAILGAILGGVQFLLVHYVL